MGSQGREDVHQTGVWRTGKSHICMWINPEEQVENETDRRTQGSSMGKESFKTSGCKNLCGLHQQEKLRASQEHSLERPTES